MPEALKYLSHTASCKKHGTLRAALLTPQSNARCPACFARCSATVIGRAAKHAPWSLEAGEQAVRAQARRAGNAAHGRKGSRSATSSDRPAQAVGSNLESPAAAAGRPHPAAAVGVEITVRGAVRIDDATLEAIARQYLEDVADGARTIEAPSTLDAMRRAARAAFDETAARLSR